MSIVAILGVNAPPPQKLAAAVIQMAYDDAHAKGRARSGDVRSAIHFFFSDDCLMYFDALATGDRTAYELRELMQRELERDGTCLTIVAGRDSGHYQQSPLLLASS